MNHSSYSFEQDKAALCFDFESISNKKVIRKRIQYSPTEIPYLYNLAMGDLVGNGVLDDSIRSNNEDRDKVIATVVKTLVVFMNQYPDYYVIFQGSTASRTRLYRAVINRELDNALELFDIYGVRANHSFEVFQPDTHYIAFILTGKK